jgi:hypothetical protein
MHAQLSEHKCIHSSCALSHRFACLSRCHETESKHFLSTQVSLVTYLCIQISVLAASAAQNALNSFQVGDSRFNVGSAVAIAQCKFGSALAAEPVMRLLAMAVLSIGSEHLPAVSDHVHDKHALISAVEATKHDLAASVAQSLRESLSKQTSQNAKGPSKQEASQHHRAALPQSTSSSIGIKHVIAALTVSAIAGDSSETFRQSLFLQIVCFFAGYICIGNKCSGFCANFHAICDAWNGKL